MVAIGRILDLEGYIHTDAEEIAETVGLAAEQTSRIIACLGFHVRQKHDLEIIEDLLFGPTLGRYFESL